MAAKDETEIVVDDPTAPSETSPPVASVRTVEIVAMLLLLEREDTKGDVWACVLLTVAVGFSSLGVSFVVGAAVDVLQRHRTRGWKRIWIAVLPGLLYLAWYAGYGHKAENHLEALAFGLI